MALHERIVQSLDIFALAELLVVYCQHVVARWS